MTGLHKVIYKPDTQSTEEYMVIVDPAEYRKWKDGDSTLPLAQIVESFEVYHSGQGNQGKLGKASKQQLETVFNTSRDDEVVKQMLEKGTLQSSSQLNGSDNSFNRARQSAFTDTRGSSGGLRGV